MGAVSNMSKAGDTPQFSGETDTDPNTRRKNYSDIILLF
jgi:hypothetical protein